MSGGVAKGRLQNNLHVSLVRIIVAEVTLGLSLFLLYQVTAIL